MVSKPAAIGIMDAVVVTIAAVASMAGGGGFGTRGTRRTSGGGIGEIGRLDRELAVGMRQHANERPEAPRVEKKGRQQEGQEQPQDPTNLPKAGLANGEIDEAEYKRLKEACLTTSVRAGVWP